LAGFGGWSWLVLPVVLFHRGLVGWWGVEGRGWLFGVGWRAHCWGSEGSTRAVGASAVGWWACSWGWVWLLVGCHGLRTCWASGWGVFLAGCGGGRGWCGGAGRMLRTSQWT